MDRKALEDLVGSINVQLDPVVRRLEVVKLDEIAEAVRDNKVPEFAPNPMSDNTLRMRATIIVEARLEAGIPAKLSEVLDELRATKPLQPPAESYAIVGGKYYLQSSLPVLPRSQAMQQAVSVCVSQALMTLMGFFVQRGYSYWDERLESALQAAFDGGSPHSVR